MTPPLQLYNRPIRQQGSIIIFELVGIFVFSLVILSVMSYAVIQARVIRVASNREEALHIAEAGINYYQWRLAHFPSDFKDGTGAAGPYVHDYKDLDGQTIIGRYSLQITAPPVGSTVATITSTGYTLANPSVTRTVTTRYGIPSLAQYGFLTNSDSWIGNTESVSGRMHSNGGIRFDGTGNAPIASAKLTYTCQPTFGCSPAVSKPGIWGSAPQSTKNFWTFPVPAVDFSSMTSDLATIKSNAQSAGIYLPPSNAQGYSLVFSYNAGTGITIVTTYKVTSLLSNPSGMDVNGVWHNNGLDYNARTLVSAQNLPVNGLIYVEDKTWVEGTLKGRALVVAAKLPYNASTAPSIFIPNNILYAVKDGTSSLGLIGQQDILVTYRAPNNLEVDAALIAQNGSTQFYYFASGAFRLKTSITIYGTIGSFGVWTWSWVNGSGTVVSGYQTTSTNYDANLLYSPPPSFPLSTSGYQQISWVSN